MHRILFNKSITFCAVVAALGGSLASAQAYNAAGDFSLTNGNPNGVWSYGTLSAVTGGTLSLFGTTESAVDYAGQKVWDNGGSIPNRAADQVNTGGSSVTYGSVVVPTGQVDLDGENLIADVRFTSPALGVYNLTGFFQRNDTNAAPVNVFIVENGATTLFSNLNFNGNGSQTSFSSLAAVSLAKGATLDFIEQASQFNNDTTGLALTVNAVPEPSTWALLGIGLAGLVLAVRRRFLRAKSF